MNNYFVTIILVEVTIITTLLLLLLLLKPEINLFSGRVRSDSPTRRRF